MNLIMNFSYYYNLVNLVTDDRLCQRSPSISNPPSPLTCARARNLSMAAYDILLYTLSFYPTDDATF